MRKICITPWTWALLFTVAALGIIGRSVMGSSAGGSMDPELIAVAVLLVAVVWYMCIMHEALRSHRNVIWRAHAEVGVGLSHRARRLLHLLDDYAGAEASGDPVGWTEGDLDELEVLGRRRSRRAARISTRAADALRRLGSASPEPPDGSAPGDSARRASPRLRHAKWVESARRNLRKLTEVRPDPP